IVTNNPVYLALIVTAGLSLRFRKQLKHSIDRRFFREAYNQERIIIELIDRVKELDSMAEISRLVSQQLDAALHPKGTYVFYRESERRDMTLGYSSGGTSQAFRIPDSSQLLHTMERFTSVQEYPLRHHSSLPQDEEEWLDRLGINLIVPMVGTDQR